MSAFLKTPIDILRSETTEDLLVEDLISDDVKCVNIKKPPFKTSFVSI